ncbi:ATPase [Halobacteriales archaeon QS_9_68_42]|nr:MAG: ATPase [Halobacteriales archaeon QS_9_68_42]
MSIEDAGSVCADVVDAVGDAVVGDETFFERLLVALLARGHVLVEDVPGTGKTLTARTLATALGLEFSRVQFTPDLLPSDVTGTNVFDEADRSFEFSPGPIFANVVLADEINRAPPKTQAALLEAMEERQVTVDGESHDLPRPFFVIATQNPVEDGETELLRRRAGRAERSPTVEPVVDGPTVSALQATPEAVRVDPDLLTYVAELGRATREDTRVEVGVSPRGVQRLFEAARAAAVIEGRAFVTPDDVAGVVVPAFAHRLVLTADATVSGIEKRAVVEEVMDAVPVPTVESAPAQN